MNNKKQGAIHPSAKFADDPKILYANGLTFRGGYYHPLIVKESDPFVIHIPYLKNPKTDMEPIAYSSGWHRIEIAEPQIPEVSLKTENEEDSIYDLIDGPTIPVTQYKVKVKVKSIKKGMPSYSPFEDYDLL